MQQVDERSSSIGGATKPLKIWLSVLSCDNALELQRCDLLYKSFIMCYLTIHVLYRCWMEAIFFFIHTWKPGSKFATLWRLLRLLHILSAHLPLLYWPWFWHYRILQNCLVFFFLSPRTKKLLIPFIGEWYLAVISMGARCAHCSQSVTTFRLSWCVELGGMGYTYQVLSHMPMCLHLSLCLYR